MKTLLRFLMLGFFTLVSVTHYNCAGSGAFVAMQIPSFPWPPPKASSSQELSSDFLKSAHSLGDVAEKLKKAMDECGYNQKSFYSIPKGFALVSQIEQINEDGSSKELPERWSTRYTPLKRFSLAEYFSVLFTSQPGYFRMIVFLVTPEPFAESSSLMTQTEAKQWLDGGINRLPDSISKELYTSNHYCTAMIYEFRKATQTDEPVLSNPSILTGKEHLQKSNLWTLLENNR